MRLNSAIIALVAAGGMIIHSAAPANAALISGTYTITGGEFVGASMPPFASTTEVVSISFDNSANILSSSSGISLVSGTITPTSTLAFSYLKAADSLVIGGIASTVTTADPTSTDFAATLSSVSGTPFITAFSYSTGTGTAFSALTTGVSFVQGVPTPEPASLAIIGTALAGLMLSRRQRRAK